MNKGFKYVIAIFLVIVAVAGVCYLAANRPKTIKPNEGIEVYIDPSGETYLAIKDEDTGETMAGVTDEDNNLYAAKIDESGNVLKDGDLYPVEDYTGEIPTNDTTKVSIEDKQSSSHNYANDEVITKDAENESEFTVTSEGSDEKVTSAQSDEKSTKQTSEKDNSTQKDNSTEKNNSTKKDNSTEKDNQTSTEATKEYLADKYKTLFKSGTYLVEFSTDDETMDTPVTAAVKNGNIYMETELEGKNCTMIYQKQKDSMYVVLTDYHVYCKMPNSMLEDIEEIRDFGTGSDVDVKKINVSTVDLGGNECICEKYTMVDGTVASYYFYEGTLVRLDNTSETGEVSVMNIYRISSDVSDSLFTLPKGFIPINLSKLDLDLDDDETTESAQ